MKRKELNRRAAADPCGCEVRQGDPKATLGSELEGASLPDGQHYAFLTLARERGLLRPEDAGRLATARHPAAQAAVELGLLAPETAQALLDALSRGRFTCGGCGQSCGYRHLATLTGLVCPRCAAPLIYREGGAQQPESGLGPPRPPSQRLTSGLGRPPSDRAPSGARPSSRARAPSERQASGLGPGSGLGRPPSDRLGADQTQVRPKAALLTRLGEYQLERELGRGNNGVVYLARRAGLARYFALKVLLSSAALGGEARQRFRLEAQIGSKLDHPGIVPVYDVVETDDHLYFAMEFCEGETLGARLKREGQIPPSEAAELIRDLADAMATAHARDVVHRDLKPGNVLLDSRAGRARITDFGLARDQELAATMTKSGDILGTPYYMAPEQLQGARPTPLVDVYALGVILYECLTGHRPHTAQTPFELAKKVLSGKVVPPLHYLPALSPDLDAICLRALALRPGERTSSAAALRDELDAFLSGRRVGPAPTRSRALPLIAGGLVLASALGAGGLAWAWHAASERARVDLLERYSAAPPTDEADLERGVERLRSLGLDPTRLAAAEAQAVAWRQLWALEPLLAAGEVEQARAALSEISPYTPSLAAALEQGAARIEREARRLALELECKGEALTAPLLGRWRELLAQAEPDSAQQARTRSALLEHLADRLAIAEYRTHCEALRGDERLRAELILAWLHLERGETESGRAALKALASQASAPPSLRDCAQGILAANEAASDKARRLSEQVLALEPALLPARVCRLMTFFLGSDGRRSAEGDELVAQLLRDHPDSAPVLTWIARIRLSKGKNQLDLVERAVTLLGEDPTERALLTGLLAAHVARDLAARDRYARLAERYFPRSIHLAFVYGLTLTWSKRVSDAMEAWRATYKRDPGTFREAALSILSPKDAEQIIRQVAQSAEGPAQAFALPLAETPATAVEQARIKVARIGVAAARGPALSALTKLVGGGGWLEVEGDFKSALAAAPKDPTLALLVAQAQLGRDRFPEAEAALERCAQLGVSARRIALLRGDLAQRLGDRKRCLELMRELSDPKHPRDSEWLCARAHVAAASGRGDAEAKRALVWLEQVPPSDPFASYMRLRISMSLSDRGQVEAALRDRFEREGLSDTSTLTYYGIEQSLRLFSGRAPQGLFEHIVEVCQRLFAISEGAWVHLAFANVVLKTPIQDFRILAWTLQRLEAADGIQPDRYDTALFRGCFALRRGRPAEEALVHWRRARELGASAQDIREVCEAFPQELQGADLSELLREP